MGARASRVRFFFWLLESSCNAYPLTTRIHATKPPPPPVCLVSPSRMSFCIIYDASIVLTYSRIKDSIIKK